MITQTISGLQDLTPEPQPEDGVTYASKIDKSEARIDWTRSATEVSQLIHKLLG